MTERSFCKEKWCMKDLMYLNGDYKFSIEHPFIHCQTNDCHMIETRSDIKKCTKCHRLVCLLCRDEKLFIENQCLDCYNKLN